MYSVHVHVHVYWHFKGYSVKLHTDVFFLVKQQIGAPIASHVNTFTHTHTHTHTPCISQNFHLQSMSVPPKSHELNSHLVSYIHVHVRYICYVNEGRENTVQTYNSIILSLSSPVHQVEMICLALPCICIINLAHVS